MNLEHIHLHNIGLMHAPYLKSAIHSIYEYALRYQEVVTGDQYRVLSLFDLNTKHSFYEARWANDSALLDNVWYDVFEQSNQSCDWEFVQTCLGLDNCLISLDGREVNKYGRWVRFAANRPPDDMIEELFRILGTIGSAP